MGRIFPFRDTQAEELISIQRAQVAEAAKQTLLLEHIAGTTVSGAAVEDWAEVAEIVDEGMGAAVFPVASRVLIPWSTKQSAEAEAVEYANNPWNVVHHGEGALADGEIIPVMLLQEHYCLPFDTQFAPEQAFIYAIDGLPAGTYNVSVAAETYGRAAGTYQFTLTQALPAGGQLAGFFSQGAAAAVKAYADRMAKTPTETCAVTSGSAGTSLGTFSSAGDEGSGRVPASGTPVSSKTLAIGGTAYHVYGLNSSQRVSWGNNRYLHAPIRQFINASGFDWYSPATVFDRPPAYAARQGFLSGFDEGFLAHVQPIARKTAVNYVMDGGTASAPAYDTTYDKFALPSGREHWLKDNQYWGGGQGMEGDPWEYWKRVSGAASPLNWSTWGDSSTYHREYVQYDLANPSQARYVWMRSCYRYGGSGVAVVSAAGGCYGNDAVGGYRVAPACAIG